MFFCRAGLYCFPKPMFRHEIVYRKYYIYHYRLNIVNICFVVLVHKFNFVLLNEWILKKNYISILHVLFFGSVMHLVFSFVSYIQCWRYTVIVCQYQTRNISPVLPSALVYIINCTSMFLYLSTLCTFPILYNLLLSLVMQDMY